MPAPVWMRSALGRGVRGDVVEAPGTAPGSERLITVAFIAIAGRIQPAQYMLGASEIKVLAVKAFGLASW